MKLNWSLSAFVALAVLLGVSRAEGEEAAALKAAGNPTVEIVTSEGTVQVELFADKAPKTVENFLKYVDDGFYNGTIFHRVIDGFMIQGGGFTPDMAQKETRAAVVNEARGDVKNLRGTLAMARRPDINSATAQFFINVVNNPSLDHRDETARGFGYAVFGKVISGMDVVDKIKSVPTGNAKGFSDVPVKPVTIISVKRVAKGG
jgi:cyclophilin family peptidyl-prolyl cis-trans isomerase